MNTLFGNIKNLVGEKLCSLIGECDESKTRRQIQEQILRSATLQSHYFKSVVKDRYKIV